MSISRRKFLQVTGMVGGGVLAGIGLTKLLSSNKTKQEPAPALTNKPVESKTGLREVMFYEKLSNNRIKCAVCPRFCIVSPGNRGYCKNKENQGGNYYALAYAQACSINRDPIEKKPFFHFLPGAQAYSLATVGCNFECLYCQNWQISQSTPEEIKNSYLPPQKIVDSCKEEKIPIIAFTYTEPTVFYEYMFDTAKLAKEKGIASVMVSNGYINESPLRQLCEQLSAVKIDLKSFSVDFYRKTCNGELQPVLDTLLTLKKLNIWFEIVVLVIPTLNDDIDEIKNMCKWIRDNLGTDVPLHFSRFSPMYKLNNLPPTPVSTLEKAYNIGQESGLKFVYLGNVTPHLAESTYCNNCKKILIKRTGYAINIDNLKDGKCTNCQTVIPGVWQKGD